MAKIERILLPQDQRMVLSNGMMNPAWYRFFVALQKQFPELIDLAEQADATQAATATLDSRVGSLERNFLKNPVDDVNASLISTSSPTFNDDLVNRIQAYGGTINTIINRLESSNIVRTE